MTDMWENQTPDNNEPTTAENTTSVDSTTEPTPAPETTSQPPLNGWSSDGSYRYVPNQNNGAPQQTPPATGSAGAGQTPPSYGGYQSTYTPNGGYGWPQQPAGATPPAYQPPVGGNKPPKKGNGWIALVAVLGALAVVGCLVLAVFAGLKALPMDGVSTMEQEGTSVQADTPSLEISQWDDNDGGLSNKEVVNRNFDATVVLTAYAQNNTFNFGESALTEVGGSSGIIMSADGYIITNWHCVINEETGKPYDRIDVTTYDGKTYEDAQVVGSDESTDLAVIKIETTGLTAAKFGDSASLSVGDRVVALGNAAGLSWTATFGYVSALARDVYDDTGYAIKCLQVDAAINYGNSGGPLLNNQGLVVGINSAKIAASGYEGLGFSIPINEAKVIIESLLKYGHVKGRVALGITGQTVSSGMYQGFMIATIDEKSSLKGTGAQVGDLIVAVDKTKVTDYGTLRSELSKHKVGDKVTLSLLRSDRYTGQVTSLTVTATLKEQTASE